MAKAATKAPAKATESEAEPKTSAFMKKMTPSKELADIVGKEPLPRSEVVKSLWVYIKKHNLQDQNNKRVINADAALEKVFGAKSCDMFQMTKFVSAHLN